MKDKIKNFFNGIISSVGEQVAAVFLARYLTKENIIAIVDAGLDVLEEIAKQTETDLDDKVLLKIREALSIPDKD